MKKEKRIYIKLFISPFKIFSLEYQNSHGLETVITLVVLVLPGDDVEVGGVRLDLLEGAGQVAGVGLALHHELVLALVAALRGAALDVGQVHLVLLQEGFERGQ